jgi:type I restriction enzyme S subunit
MKNNMKLKQIEVSEMPNSWQEHILSEAITVNPQRGLKKGSQVKFVSMADLNTFDKTIRGFIFRDFSGGSKFINGDTLMARITPCLENGKTVYVDILEENEVAGGSTEFIVLSGKEGKTINEFVYYLTISPEIRQKAIQSMTGTSGRQRVENDVFNNIIINLPDLDEQYAITKILSDLDKKVELNHQMNKTLETIVQAMFKRWFVDFEFSGYENVKFVNGLPMGWEIRNIYEAVDIIYGAPFSSNLFNTVGNGKPLIRIRDLANEKSEVFTPEEHPKGYLIKPGDIVVGMDGEFRAHLWGGQESWLNQRICVFVPKKGFSSPFVINSIIPLLAEVEATETATTVIHLGKNDIDKFEILIPDAQVLNLFNQLAGPLFAKIVVNKQELFNLSQIRDSLLPMLVSGRIRANM